MGRWIQIGGSSSTSDSAKVTAYVYPPGTPLPWMEPPDTSHLSRVGRFFINRRWPKIEATQRQRLERYRAKFYNDPGDATTQ